MFIKLTMLPTGVSTHINLNKIIAIQEDPFSEGTLLYVDSTGSVHSSSCYRVKETPEEIIAMIDERRWE